MNIIKYLRESRAEFKHINWPTQRSVAVFTTAVIVISLVTAALLGAFDVLFLEGINYITSL